MTKKFLPGLLLAGVCCVAFFSCKKTTTSTADATRNYFPLTFGKYITYAVDSIIYDESTCTQIEVKSQLKYSITDTFRDQAKKLSYILDIYSRPYDGGVWKPIRVIYLTPTTTGLLYNQDNAQVNKLMFPITENFTWQGNINVPVGDPSLSYLKNWNYVYKNLHKSYNHGLVNFDNTVTVIEDDESVNYPNFDSGVASYRTYAKEVYAYNVGMVYKEFTHWTSQAFSDQCVNGYTVIMQAIEYN